MTIMLTIDISKQSDLWPALPALIDKAVKACISEGEISIVLADNNFIQNLNHVYRGKDKPTNVLSFPQDEPGLLGDVILAYETIEKEANEQEKSFEDHLTHLIVHGTLHLLGHDHEDDKEAKEMEALEIEILEKLGIKNPYEINDKTQNFMR